MAFQTLREIMGGGLPLQGRVHRQHHLVDAPVGHAGDQRIDGEIFRSYSLQS